MQFLYVVPFCMARIVVTLNGIPFLAYIRGIIGEFVSIPRLDS